MRTLGGVFATMTIAGLLAAGAATPSDAATKHARTRSRAYDGLWSVSIRTQFGPCDPSYRYPARIVGGQVVQADGSLHKFVNIYVDDDDVRYLEGVDTPVPDGAEISILPAVAGG